ncbi:MAG: helix-turn-helix domain-containing protein [Bacillota bacterium]
MEERFLTPKEAAEVLKVPRLKIWRLIREGKLPVLVLSPRQRRIPLSALTRLAKGGE